MESNGTLKQETLKGNLKEKLRPFLKGNLKEKFEGNLIWGTMAIVAGGTTRARAGEPKEASDRAPPLGTE